MKAKNPKIQTVVDTSVVLRCFEPDKSAYHFAKGFFNLCRLGYVAPLKTFTLAEEIIGVIKKQPAKIKAKDLINQIFFIDKKYALSDNIELLAYRYMNFIPSLEGEFGDSKHVAAAACHGISLLVSSNYNHLSVQHTVNDLWVFNKAENKPFLQIIGPEDFCVLLMKNNIEYLLNPNFIPDRYEQVLPKSIAVLKEAIDLRARILGKRDETKSLSNKEQDEAARQALSLIWKSRILLENKCLPQEAELGRQILKCNFLSDKERGFHSYLIENKGNANDVIDADSIWKCLDTFWFDLINIQKEWESNKKDALAWIGDLQSNSDSSKLALNNRSFNP